MKTFQKQLVPSVVIWVLLFGAVVYWSFWGLDRAVSTLTERSALLVAEGLRTRTQDVLESSRLRPTNNEPLRKALLKELAEYDFITDLFLVDGAGKVLLAVRKTRRDTVALAPDAGVANGNAHVGGDIRVWRATQQVQASWPLRRKGLYAVLVLDPKARLLGSLYDSLTLKYYLLGFGGLLAMGLLAWVGHRVIRAPLAKVEKAMTVIDKRKYGYRLKWKGDDEFAGTYQKVNLALRRLEQLDAVQRSAVQRRNSALKELKTVSRFLDIMAHEIKNPLHALGINLDVLKTKIRKGQSKEATLKHAEILEQELDHLQEVVMGFLSFVRPGVPKKEKADLNEVVRNVCQMVSAEAEQARVKIETRLVKNLRRVLLDPAQFRQALHNVVINAIHATGEGGRIRIRSWAKRNKVLVEVRDNGPGIPRDELKKVFDLYYTTKKGGSGLGLPVTRRIVEANGGQMQLESTVGKGTTITFMFQT